MNGKKARAIREFCKEQNAWGDAPKYRKIYNKRVMWVKDSKTGDLKPQEFKIGTFTLVNDSKYSYRRMKKAYSKEGYNV